MSTAPKYQPRYSVADYQLWDGDWELWEGVAVAMTPSPFGPHSKLLVNVAAALKSGIRDAAGDATVLAEIDWILSSNTVLRPNLLVVCGAEPDRHVQETPALVVEILSDSTRERDLTYKRIMYQEQRVPYYLVVDPDASQLTALQLQADESYSEIGSSETLSIDICGDCRFQLTVDNLFR